MAVEDLRSLVTLSPDATGWRWDVEPQTRLLTPPQELDEARPSYAYKKALTDAYSDAGLVKAATSSWGDHANMKQASSFLPVGAAGEMVGEGDESLISTARRTRRA